MVVHVLAAVRRRYLRPGAPPAVEGLAAEHYRRVISEKTRDALARLRQNGRRVSRWAPYGFSFATEGRLAPEPREQAVLDRIEALRVAGLSLRAISEELAASGILARNGRRFAPQTLVRLVTRRAGPRMS
jgi:DNA invertase Pin-like site-specific DNA recombinase